MRQIQFDPGLRVRRQRTHRPAPPDVDPLLAPCAGGVEGDRPELTVCAEWLGADDGPEEAERMEAGGDHGRSWTVPRWTIGHQRHEPQACSRTKRSTRPRAGSRLPDA